MMKMDVRCWQSYGNNRSSGNHCGVRGCNNSSRKLNELLSVECFDHKPLKRADCSCLKPFRLFKPKTDQERREWLAKLNLKKPPVHLFVCSFHFTDKEPTFLNPLPQLYLGYDCKVKTRRVLARCQNPVIQASPVVKRKSTTVTPAAAKRRASLVPVSTHSLQPAGEHEALQPAEEHEALQPAKRHKALQPSKNAACITATEQQPEQLSSQRTVVDIGVQWNDIALSDHNYHRMVVPRTQIKTDHKAVQCTIQDDNSIAKQLIQSNADARLYTGINLDVFWELVSSAEYLAQSSISIPVCDQVLMTLMKLRLNLLIADLSRRFGVSAGFVSTVISFWIEKLSVLLSQIIVWLPREKIRGSMPECFKNYPKTTCIMDCAETIMQKSANLKSRGESYSNYKSHNTIKYCVTIAPCGYIMHISKAYGGRCSDKFIVQDCGVLDNLLPGDEVMADRGFTIQDLLFPKHVKLNIPAFSHGKQMSETEVTRTRRIANVRIHVERVIRKMKIFRILKDIVPISMTKKIDDILIVVAALVNLDNSVIHHDKN